MALKSAPSAILKHQREKMKRHAARPSTIARAIFLPVPPLAGYAIRASAKLRCSLNFELGHENGVLARVSLCDCHSADLRKIN